MATYKGITDGTYVGTSVATNLPAHVSGDLLVACISRHGPAHTNPAGSSNLSSLDGWVQIINTAGATFSPKLTLAYKFANSNSETAPNFAFTGSTSGSWHIACISGADPSAPVDVVGSQQSGSSNSITVGGVTTQTANALLLAFAAFNNNNSEPSTGTWSERSDQANQQYNAGVVGTKTTTSAGNVASESWSNVQANPWSSVTIAIRPNVGVVTTAAVSASSVTPGTVNGSGPSTDPQNVDPSNSLVTDANVNAEMEFTLAFGSGLASKPFNVVVEAAVGPMPNFPDDVSGVLTARLFQSNGTTAMTDLVEVASFDDSSPTDGSYAINLTNPNQSPSLAVWRGNLILKLVWTLD